MLCTNGIVGSGIPVAAGAARVAQLQGTNQVVLCCFGDGVSTPYDATGLPKSAIRDDNPVVFIEQILLYFSKGLVPDGEYGYQYAKLMSNALVRM